MQILNDINWRVLAQQVQSSLNENEVRFRRIWVSNTRLGSVQFILFPANSNEMYRIVTYSKFVDCNKNVFAYSRSFDSTLSFETPPSERDREIASERLTEELARVFAERINKELTPAS